MMGRGDAWAETSNTVRAAVARGSDMALALLLLLEPMTRELQRPAVLSYRAHYMIWGPVRYLGFQLNRHRDRWVGVVRASSSDND